MLNLMLFTKDTALAQSSQKAGISRIVIDIESRAKMDRQGGYHLDCNYDTIGDLRSMRRAVNIPIVCRVNPISVDSKDEINEAIAAGADILMLPMFKNTEEAAEFVHLVAGRVMTILLLETKEAVDNAKEIAKLDYDEVFIGLNDLAISYGKSFAYELLLEDLLCDLRSVFKNKPFGFGGITILGKGSPLPTRFILKELARLHGDSVIIRRAFKRDILGHDISLEVKKIQAEYSVLLARDEEQISADRVELVKYLEEILGVNSR